MLFALTLNTQINKSTYPSLPFHSLPCFSLPPPLSCLLFLHKIKSFVHFISSLCVFVLRRIQRCIIPLNGPSKQAIGLHPCKLPVSQHSSACIQVFILWEDSSEGWIPPLLCVWSDFITRSGKMLSSDGVWSQRLLSAQTHLERDVEALQQQIHQPSPRAHCERFFAWRVQGSQWVNCWEVACSRWPLLSSVSIQKDAGGVKAHLNTWILMCVEEI